MKNLYNLEPLAAARGLYIKEADIREEAQSVARRYFRKNSATRTDAPGDLPLFALAMPKTFGYIMDAEGNQENKDWQEHFYQALVVIAAEDLGSIEEQA